MSSENNNLDNNYARTPPELNFPLLTLEDIRSKPHKWLSEEIKSQLPTDILLMTANDDEFTACYSYMKDVQRGYCMKLGIVDFGRFVSENNLEVKVALMKHEQGTSATQTAVTDAAGVLCPKVTLLVGICDTMEPARVKLGDVVISAKLATYDDKKIMENGKVEYRGPKPEVSPNMAKLILHAADGWKPPLKDPKSINVEVHRDGLMLSGSDSIKNRERLEELRTYFHDALVIEIGGRGLYEAANNLKMEWAVIKGVSDFAGESEDLAELWTRFSSAMAASVVHNIFKYPVLLEGWRHYREAEDTNVVTPAACSQQLPEHVSIEQFLRSIVGEGTRICIVQVNT